MNALDWVAVVFVGIGLTCTVLLLQIVVLLGGMKPRSKALESIDATYMVEAKEPPPITAAEVEEIAKSIAVPYQWHVLSPTEQQFCRNAAYKLAQFRRAFGGRS